MRLRIWPLVMTDFEPSLKLTRTRGAIGWRLAPFARSRFAQDIGKPRAFLSGCFPRERCGLPLSMRKPRGAGRIVALVQGFLSGFATPVNGKTLHFVERH
jgi:hypothetical protein